MEKEKKVTPFRHEVLSKSNFFIGAKYKASVLEHQITYLAMFKIQEREYEERGDGIYVTMSASEIKDATGNQSGSFYTRLKRVADEMTGNSFGIVDDEKEEFVFITPINRATYKDGEFTIRFALELKNYLVNVETDFTKVPKQIAMKLKKKPYSFPLYQVLKKQCYYPKGYTGAKDYVFSVVIGISELKLEMGLINIKESPDVKRALLSGRGTTEDYDNAVSKSKDKMFNSLSDFETKCLKPTIEEINNNSDIYVEYTKKKKGRGGKVYAFDFTVWLDGCSKKGDKDTVSVSLDKSGNVSTNISQEEMFEFCMKAYAVLAEYNLRLPDIQAISEAANYNLDKINKAKSLLEKTGEVQNVTGWIISCIQNDYGDSVSKPAQKKNQFHNFPEREVSGSEMSNLEKQLLNLD